MQKPINSIIRSAADKNKKNRLLKFSYLGKNITGKIKLAKFSE